jgi:hypothetical protein
VLQEYDSLIKIMIRFKVIISAYSPDTNMIEAEPSNQERQAGGRCRLTVIDAMSITEIVGKG